MIANRSDLAGDDERAESRTLALDCVAAGIDAARPRRVVGEAVELDGEGRTLTVAGESYDLGAFEEVVVLGGGKAAAGVAAALDGILGERVDRGVVVTDDSAVADRADDSAVVDRADAGPSAGPARIEVREGDHPVPSERGVAAAREVLDLADDAGSGTLVLAVVTGGGSALLAAPADGVSLADLREATTELLESGATIAEINAVRKHCSALKGGRLAERAAPATVVGLALSDVVGDDLGVVASGPLSPDATTFGDALDVLDRHGVDAPRAVRERLERGARGEIPETPKPGDAAFDRVSVHVVASATTALRAAAETAREAGYDPLILSSRVRGEAREAAKTHAAVAEEIRATGDPVEPPAVVLSGGETTVTVRGDGEGGPNLEFALLWALDVDAGPDAPVVLASVDTDGRDGGTDAAGALVDAGTVAEREAAGFDGGGSESASSRIPAEVAREALADNDALAPLADAGRVVRTGSTGTNVNDLRVTVVEGDEADAES